MGAVGGAGALGGAGDAFATLLPPELPELFPRLLKPLDGRFEKFYRVLTFDDDTGALHFEVHASGTFLGLQRRGLQREVWCTL